MKNPPELLAPAGDFESLRAAIHFGADAVYLGGPMLQMRSVSTGFSEESLAEAIRLAHSRGVFVYVALNSLATGPEVDKAGEYIRLLDSVGADAVIVSDLGVLTAVKQAAPEMKVHISTQASCMNYLAARRYYDMGAERIILARELDISGIADIRAKTPPDLTLEAFVHGSMCMAYSGRCLISAFLNSRSANKGECSQPCRWQYHLMEHKRPGQYFEIEENESGTSILSSYDLCCIGMLGELYAAGVGSFKIEGRMKSAYYVGTVTNAYRRAIDGGDTSALRPELDCVSHRPYSEGFYHGAMKKGDVGCEGYEQTCLFAANVQKGGRGIALVRQRNRFSVGDALEIVSPKSLGLSFRVESITDSDGNELISASTPMQEVRINCPYELSEGDLLRIRVR